MLKWDIDVVRSQWPFVRGFWIYEDVYYNGIPRTRTRYGELALWQMVAAGRSERFTEAFKAFWGLLRCYPAGFVDLFKGKASKSFIFWKQRSA